MVGFISMTELCFFSSEVEAISADVLPFAFDFRIPFEFTFVQQALGLIENMFEIVLGDIGWQVVYVRFILLQLRLWLLTVFRKYRLGGD